MSPRHVTPTWMSPFTRARHGDLHVAGVWVLAPPDGLRAPQYPRSVLDWYLEVG